MLKKTYYHFSTREIHSRERNFDRRPSAFVDGNKVTKQVNHRERVEGMAFYERLLNAGWERIDAKTFVLRMFDME